MSTLSESTEPEPPSIDRFPALTAITGLRHGFTTRVPGLAVDVDREAALRRLDRHHAAALAACGLDHHRMARCRQVHGPEVLMVGEGTDPGPVPLGEADALVTSRRDVALGIYVADCCAVFAIDPRSGAIGLAHAGRKGTELGVVPAMLAALVGVSGADAEPSRLLVQLSPCIRPPHYEVDFAAGIVAQCRKFGVPAGRIHDCGRCTHDDPARYYSYRRERGQTGRMLAFAGWGG